MQCPVPTRSGHVMQLRDIYKQWLEFPSENGTGFYATFVCPASGLDTMLASSEQVDLVLSIASSLRLDISTAPLIFQYKHHGTWHNFRVVDQIQITAMCCNLHRRKSLCGMNTTLVCGNDFNLTIVVTKKIADLYMQAVHNSDQLHTVRLLDSTPRFFWKWLFIAHPDEVEG